MKEPTKENKSRRITVAEMAPHVHIFLHDENKADKLAKWLADWIEKSLNSGKIKPFDFLPLKGDLAFHLGVSLGTMQNVFRLVEDLGLIESKQRIGSYIADKNSNHLNEKLTSKRDMACEKIKKYIMSGKYKAGDIFCSTRELAQKTGISTSTVRIAMNALASAGILEKKGKVYIVKTLNYSVNSLKNLTLAEKISLRIKDLLSSGIKKLPSNIELAKKYKVSVKTIHDALKILSKEGLVLTKRGQYGTIILEEDSEREPYLYEKAESKIKNFIIQNCKVGDKLPPIKEFAEKCGVSVKTIKKALDNLESDGYVRFTRGRYGGTFLTDYPDKKNYTWLAINAKFLE